MVDVGIIFLNISSAEEFVFWQLFFDDSNRAMGAAFAFKVVTVGFYGFWYVFAEH